jgi:hypothetical protein
MAISTLIKIQWQRSEPPIYANISYLAKSNEIRFKGQGHEYLACVLWISEVSVAIFSPALTDSTRKSWRSIERMGTVELSTVNSPVIGSDSAHRVATLPVIRKPPAFPQAQYIII